MDWILRAIASFVFAYLGARLFYRMVGAHQIREMCRASFDRGATEMMALFPQYAREFQKSALESALEAFHSTLKGQDREAAIEDAVQRRGAPPLPNIEDLPNRP